MQIALQETKGILLLRGTTLVRSGNALLGYRFKKASVIKTEALYTT
jgi:hypothetical protein